MTQIEQTIALFKSMPGDTATWLELSGKLQILQHLTDPMYKGPERDGTIDEHQWGHIRNVARAADDLAFALASMERGDDPDIPF